MPTHTNPFTDLLKETIGANVGRNNGDAGNPRGLQKGDGYGHIHVLNDEVETIGDTTGAGQLQKGPCYPEPHGLADPRYWPHMLLYGATDQKVGDGGKGEEGGGAEKEMA